jgi:hypothetical protein
MLRPGPTLIPARTGPTKTKQINVRLTAAQEAALKRFCLQGGISTQAAVLEALAGLIHGFPKP